jgi:adenine-specific DNA-methyltransferase
MDDRRRHDLFELQAQAGKGEGGMIQLHHGDCLEILPTLPANSVDCVITDPPYFRVKGEEWDRQWDNPAAFIAWLSEVVAELARVLKPNGSLYLFASPRMAARVEVMVSEHLNPLNRIRWLKAEGWHKKADKEAIRSYLSNWEEIIFAEHHGADNIAKGEAGYQAKCDELRGFIFEPLRAYLDGERIAAGIENSQINAAWCAWKGVNSTSQTQKWFSPSCFNPPTPSAYEWLRTLFSQLTGGGAYFRREYEDLRREYEDLRREYEDLRRPFNASPDTPYTDVWDFATVPTYTGKHPCEKPQDMLEHMILTSTRPDAVILDCFMGIGTTGQAARRLGRGFIGIERDARYFARAEARLSSAAVGQAVERMKREKESTTNTPRTMRMEMTI